MHHCAPEPQGTKVDTFVPPPFLLSTHRTTSTPKSKKACVRFDVAAGMMTEQQNELAYQDQDNQYFVKSADDRKDPDVVGPLLPHSPSLKLELEKMRAQLTRLESLMQARPCSGDG